MLTQSKKIKLLRSFRIIVTYFPIFSIMCSLFGAICYYWQFPKSPICYDLANFMTYISGGSLLTYIVLYLASKVLEIGRWNRILIIGIMTIIFSQICIVEFYNNPDYKGELMVKSSILLYGLLLLLSFGSWLLERKRNKSQGVKLNQEKMLLLNFECHSCDAISDRNKSHIMKLFILFLKYTPVVTFMLLIWNNLAYVTHSGIVGLRYSEYLASTGIFFLVIFFIASYLFEFCNWYRALLVGAFLNITLGTIHYIFFYTYNSAYIPNLLLLILFIAVVVSMTYKFVLHR